MKHLRIFLFLLGLVSLATPLAHANRNIFYEAAIRAASMPKVRSFPITRHPHYMGGYKITNLSGIYSKTPLARSIFRAHPKNYDSSFSGTIFKTMHNGKEEKFAAIASHTLHIISNDGLIDPAIPHSLGKHISAEIFDEKGDSIPIKFKVVQVGATPMSDVTLLKILPEYEDLVNALELNLQDLPEEAPFSVQGFTQKPFQFMNRLENLHITRVSPLSLRAPIPGEENEIIGLCGGVAVNEEGKIIGIFIGYVDMLEPNPLIGYIAPAKFLQTLVNAYYHEPEGTFPLELHGQKIIDLKPEEFISFITLRDEQLNILKAESGSFKFSHRKANELLNTYPSTRYIELEIGKMVWNENNPEYLDMFQRYRRVVYDLQESQVLRDIILRDLEK